MANLIEQSRELDVSIQQTLKSIDRKSADEEKSEMKEIGIFYNNRVHAVFSDETSLVLHPNKQCLTYYSSSGGKTRLLAGELPNFDGIKRKYRIACQVMRMIDSVGLK